jgi:hypothetical protein
LLSKHGDFRFFLSKYGYFEQFLPQNKNHVRIAIKNLPQKRKRWLLVPETPEPLCGLSTKNSCGEWHAA